LGHHAKKHAWFVLKRFCENVGSDFRKERQGTWILLSVKNVNCTETFTTVLAVSYEVGGCPNAAPIREQLLH